MRANLKTLGIGATIALVLAGMTTTTARSAELGELYSSGHRAIHIHRARMALPVMINGFALGAVTYTYRSSPNPWYFNNFWFRDCTPRPAIVGYADRGRPIIRLVGACP